MSLQVVGITDKRKGAIGPFCHLMGNNQEIVK